MRKITSEVVNALYGKGNFNKSNTVVEYLLQPHSETSDVYLFDNLIARYNHRSEELQIFNQGWYSNTTKERLNGILGAFNGSYIKQHRFVWYVVLPNGKEVPFKEGMILNVTEDDIENGIGA